MASIQKTKNGTWRVQIELRGRREYKTFPVKNLAVAWANQREAEIAQGKVQSSATAERTPFSTVIQTFRDRELPKLRNRSYKFMLNTLDECFGRHRLVDLQKKDFARFRDDRLDEGLAPASVLKELNLARRLVDYAIRDMDIYLPSNVARNVDNPKVNNARDRPFISADEERRLFRAFPSDDNRHIATLALETACRLGEMLAMEWHHVDLDRRTLATPQGTHQNRGRTHDPPFLTGDRSAEDEEGAENQGASFRLLEEGRQLRKRVSSGGGSSTRRLHC